jgi:PEP-CTERM motif
MFKFYGAFSALLLSAGLQAAVIPGLLNTGVVSAGVQLADANGIADPHWQQNGNTAFTYSINRAGFGTIYIPETLTGVGSDQSRWISVDGFGAVGSTPVPFTLSFDLTGFFPTTASLTGRWATDNCGSAQLNGGAAFSTIGNCGSSTSFTQWTPFSATSGFVAGLNTLTFNLTNDGGPGAIRVEFLSSDVTPTPEPGTYALMGAALVALGWVRKRQRQ